MIEGYATPEKTKANATGPYSAIGHTELGTTALMASQAGFGCYRVNAGIKMHELALAHALSSGINLIDTSTNYGDGGSETLVGQVVESLITSKALSRQGLIIVSKAGYLQGDNFTLSQKRRQEGRPFPELVAYGEGLEHCIHPEFLADQLTGSLDRLNLKTLDILLLHNPEYYLGWASKHGITIDNARKTYYQRIRKAFEHLEKEVERGRIRFYGISSNTFPNPADDPEFTSLETILAIAESISPRHHFRVIQMPMNLLETGAVVEKNQDNRQSVLAFANKNKIGVLINRPLNAISGSHLIRLADIEVNRAQTENEIIRSIRDVGLSETRLWKKLLPNLNIPQGLKMRVKEQIAVSDGLKHYWRNFGSWERWRQVRDANFAPRIQGVIDFLENYSEGNPDIGKWIKSHRACLKTAYRAVGSPYAEAASVKLHHIEKEISAADPDWQSGGTLSQKAFRAVRSTSGVSSVLVGMRRIVYVDDIIEELQRSIPQKGRQGAWEALHAAVDSF